MNVNVAGGFSTDTNVVGESDNQTYSLGIWSFTNTQLPKSPKDAVWLLFLRGSSSVGEQAHL